MAMRSAEQVVDHFVSVVLSHLDREYPNKLDHVMNGPEDVKGPKQLHPIFYGSFDWHSSVHGHWLLVRALRLYPNLAQRAEVVQLLDARFTSANVEGEVAYLKQPLRATFERPYGWAWLLKLAAECRTPASEGVSAPVQAHVAAWGNTLAPLSDAFASRLSAFLPKATYPIRVGTHHNTAFALALSLDYAKTVGDRPLEEAICAKAIRWYGDDAQYHGWEPDGSDFQSPGLVEAECMRRVLPPEQFRAWFDRFLPNLVERQPRALFTPAIVSDRTDGQITHLDGLNLSRAWCWRTLAASLPDKDPRRPIMLAASAEHLEAALPHVSGDYMGEHWLATFAMLALTEPA